MHPFIIPKKIANDKINHPHVIPNIREDIMRNMHSSAIDSTHKVLQLLYVEVSKGNGYLQTYHKCMQRHRLTIGKLVHDKRINNPPPEHFSSEWDEKDYLEKAFAENIHSFCLCVGRDPDEYAKILYEDGLAWVRLQVVNNSSEADVLPFD